MKVSAEKIKARGAQFQEEGLRVRATLELNAGINRPRFRSRSKDLKIIDSWRQRSREHTKASLRPVASLISLPKASEGKLCRFSSIPKKAIQERECSARERQNPSRLQTTVLPTNWQTQSASHGFKNDPMALPLASVDNLESSSPRGLSI